MIRLTIEGNPVTWSRAKFNLKDKRFFNDSKMVIYQNRIADNFRIQAGLNFCPVTSPVFIQIKAFFQCPMTYPKWKKELAAEESLPYIHTPDADNLAKNVCDALQGLAYDNDARVTDISISKRYSNRPRVEVEIFFLPEERMFIKKSTEEVEEQLNLFKGEAVENHKD